jgi:multidrug efflux pump subunit AcrA (membrane-fusion protein)
VTANAATDAITIINLTGYEATASLTDTQVSEVKIGDRVQVAVNGSGTLTGTVSRVGPVQVSDSAYTYPLAVALPVTTQPIFAGSTANLQIVLHQVNYALAVPTSAMHTNAPGETYVLIVANGKETEKKVSVGVVGATYTQITSGLTKGTKVVLADLSEAIPSSNTDTATSGFGGFGGAGQAGGAR